MATASGAMPKRGFWSRIAPALTLAAVSPLFAEILPGATRFGAFFVFPIEMAIWGGGAVMIRELVRRGNLGWLNMLLLALALATAEEWLIQQTSLAPVITHTLWGREWGINTVYFLWALGYEAVLVVFLPILFVEMIFPSRRHARWLNGAGWVTHALLFALACPLAWFGWTQVARIRQFGMAPYTPSPAYLIAAVAAIAVLAIAALGPWRRALAREARPLRPPPAPLLALGGALWAAIWFVIEALAFGAKESVPPVAAVAAGLGVAALIVLLLPRFAADPRWSDRHRAWLIAGTMVGTMLALFGAGFDPVKAPLDFWFKAGVDTIATALFALLIVKVSRRPAA